MQGNPDHQTGFNLVLCYYALEDGLSMRKAFQRLAAIPIQASAFLVVESTPWTRSTLSSGFSHVITTRLKKGDTCLEFVAVYRKSLLC